MITGSKSDFSRAVSKKCTIDHLLKGQYNFGSKAVDSPVLGELRRVRFLANFLKTEDHDGAFKYILEDNGSRIDCFSDKSKNIKENQLVEVIGLVGHKLDKISVNMEIIIPRGPIFQQLRDEEIKRLTREHLATIDVEKLKNSVWELIIQDDSDSGFSFQNLQEKIGLPEDQLKEILQSLLNESAIFEPTSQNYKSLE